MARGAGGAPGAGDARTSPATVVLLAGPSGSGKSHLARRSGLPILNLDDFYRDGDDPGLPRHPDLGIPDWDDPASWDAEQALAAIERLSRQGAAEVPIYDIASDRRSGLRVLRLDGAPAFVAEGLFAAELVRPLRDRGVPVRAVLLYRAPWKNYLRRLARDLQERRKPPLTLLRRGLVLMRAERALVTRLEERGCTRHDSRATRSLLAGAARGDG